MTSMSSRQRVQASLNREPVDRVPIDFGASRVSGIAAIAYNNLVKHLRLEETIRLYDIKQQLALPSMAMIDRLGGDVIQLNRLGPDYRHAVYGAGPLEEGHSDRWLSLPDAGSV